MNEPMAMELEVDAFARGVGREQDADRALRWVGLELRLDALSAIGVHAAVEHLDPVLHLALGQVLGETLVEVVLRVAVLGEDDDSLVVPGTLAALPCGPADLVDELEELHRLGIVPVLP